MLVVIIVIAILGTNLLLGFFVANTLGYGPQTVNELLTGIYKVPIGWTIKRLATGKLKPEHRLSWAKFIGAACTECPSEKPDDPVLDSADIENESEEEEEANDFQEEAEDDLSDDQGMDSGAADDASDIPADLQLIRRVSNFVQYSPILMDELRFQWQYLPDLTKEDEAADSVIESESDAESEDGETSSIQGEDGSLDSEDDEVAADQAEDKPSASTDPLADFWTKQRLVDSLDQWNDYLENYEPTEIKWWLEWYGRWDSYAKAWRDHCTEVLAVGLVERLLEENQPEPEPVLEQGPVSVKAVKEQPKDEVKPAAPVNPRQQWIHGQYSRLLQSLFSSAAVLRKAQLDLLDFSLQQSLQQWDKSIRVGDELESQAGPGLPPLLECRVNEDFQPTFAILLIPDYRQLLEIDNGKLVAEAVDQSVFRTVSSWIQSETLSGQWYRTPSNNALGLLTDDEATVRQKASWINQSLAKASFLFDGFSLSQSCSIVICQLPAEGSPLEVIYQMLAKVNEKPIGRRMANGNSLWQLNGKKFRAFAKDEAETEPMEINLDFSGTVDEDDLPDLGAASEEDDDGEDW